MKRSKVKAIKRDRRHRRIRAKISGTKKIPRLSVFRSNQHIYAQLIDDLSQTTLAESSTALVKGNTPAEKAHTAGNELAKKAIEKKIKRAVFDRGGFVYTGKIKAFAEGAREGGLKF